MSARDPFPITPDIVRDRIEDVASTPAAYAVPIGPCYCDGDGFFHALFGRPCHIPCPGRIHTPANESRNA